MTELFVEAWAPEYGNPFEADLELADPSKVDDTVEVASAWDPIAGRRRRDRHRGVRRRGATGRCQAHAGRAGRVRSRGSAGPTPSAPPSGGRDAPRTDIDRVRIDRLAVFGQGGRPGAGGGAAARLPVGVRAGERPGHQLIQRFHGAMRKAEAVLSEALAQEGCFVVADGPINDLSATEKVGFIKTHRAPYLPPERIPVVAALRRAERTPLFLIGKEGAYPRYSWYQRLADPARRPLLERCRPVRGVQPSRPGDGTAHRRPDRRHPAAGRLRAAGRAASPTEPGAHRGARAAPATPHG